MVPQGPEINTASDYIPLRLREICTLQASYPPAWTPKRLHGWYQNSENKNQCMETSNLLRFWRSLSGTLHHKCRMSHLSLDLDGDVVRAGGTTESKPWGFLKLWPIGGPHQSAAASQWQYLSTIIHPIGGFEKGGYHVQHSFGM